MSGAPDAVEGFDHLHAGRESVHGTPSEQFGQNVVNSGWHITRRSALAAARGNTQAKSGALGAFIDQVRAETGKTLTAAQALYLVSFAGAL